ncbi:protein-disulfide reductase DsbD [Tahibacter amnicola]|uniref:Thiol:disulfide interchange protein DsbD n=1 Tax=Tahibacter amnicola TaxID=2976241 RepID=A0ABY6BFJ5_9GAMM|nr:protein-disulfide reductase DsbD [Tahibacter amnicola]UXI68796.1 protein-disulfide reductase DsbD [Tahibacter amnicola]
MSHRISRFLAGLAAFLGMGSATAQSDDLLLPVEKAFALTATAPTRDTVRLDWKVADGYYLYRSRIKTKAASPAVTLGTLDLAPGEKKHDEFLGDVEVYHGSATATQSFTLADPAADTVEFMLSIQGCHELDPKICYPPSNTKVSLRLPPVTATTAAALREPAPAPVETLPVAAPAASTSLKDALGQIGGKAIATPADPAEGEAGLPLPPEQAFRFEAIASSPTELLARWTMPKGYYLYRDKTQLTVKGDAGIQLGAPRWPEGKLHKDEKFGMVTVFFDQVELPIPLILPKPGGAVMTLEASFQGCEDNGVCYPVMTRTVSIDLPAATAEQVAASQKTPVASTDAAGEQSEEQVLAARLSSDRLMTLLWFFGFGLLLAFTPCVFPMLPILSGIIAGAGENVSTKRALVLSLVYVLASTAIFTIAGVVAGLVGANLQAVFQKPWILWSFAGLFVALSLSMFGFYELQLPSSWQSRIATVSNRQQGGSLIGVAIMGVLSALIVGPCVAPPLAAAVLYISQTRDPFFGGLALFVLSLGMGAPLVVAGTAAGRFLPRAGAWMDAVKSVFGVSFLALAIWMLSRILDPTWIMLMSGALAIACAVFLGALERLPEHASGWRTLWKSLGVLLLIFGAAQLVGVAAGSRDLLQPLKGLGGGGAPVEEKGLPFRTIKSVDDLDRELAAGKTVMLDFYADWCVACKEMEHLTFTEPSVHQALSGITLLKADVTANDDVDQALMKRFGLVGPPATLFFDASGQEVRPRRLIGFEAADKFVARVQQVPRG